MKFTGVLVLFLLLFSGAKQSVSQMQFGVFTDCQYCDCETKGTRFYRNSLMKLENCISLFNENPQLEFVAGLGDLIDRNVESYTPVNEILATSSHPVYQVAGNHDFEVEKQFLDEIPSKLKLSKTYYSFLKNGWQFIFLNGNEITFNSNDPEIVKQAEQLFAKLTAENKPNAFRWNGGMSSTQIDWLETELQQAKEKKYNVVIFCHYPLLPLEQHTLWNSDVVLKVLSKFDNIKLWINGHNHAGNSAYFNGIHFVNLKGMVETESENAFAEFTLSADSIRINGYGREPDRFFRLN